MYDMYVYRGARTPEEKAAKAQQDVAARLAFFRRCRDQKLAACDWTQLPDAQLTELQKAAWTEYRQALRDLPATATPDGFVTWPREPLFRSITPSATPVTSPIIPAPQPPQPRNIEQHFNFQ